MQPSRKPLIFSCLILTSIVLVCFCLLLMIAAGSLWLPGELGRVSQAEKPTPFPLDGLPQSPAAEETAPIPDGLVQKMREIQLEVIAMRGLVPSTEIPRAFLTSTELRDVVVNDMFAEYTPEEIAIDQLELELLGLVEPGFDLLRFYQDLYAEQIAGFYDPETGEMYVVKGSDFGLTQQLTYAHEYTHVLQDQNFHFIDALRLSDEACEQESEQCAAVRALIEGDASLTEYQWQDAHFSTGEFSEWMSSAVTFESPVYDRAPEFFRQDLLFPYLYGLNFAHELFDQGGWDALNSAYQNPPVSTEQIIHPNAYPDDLIIPVSIPSLEGILDPDLALIDQGAMGEWNTYAILAFGVSPEIRLPIPEARQAARGWGGDAYRVYANEDLSRSVLVFCTEWDSPADAEEFFIAFTNYGNLRWDNLQADSASEKTWSVENGWNTIKRTESRTCWVSAPDPDQLNSISSGIMEP